MNTLDYLKANRFSGENTFVKQAQFTKDNWAWLKYSYAVAIRARSRMVELGITQKKLAEEMGCTQQHISVLLSGRSNMTLETIAKLEKALKFKLLSSILSPLQDSYTPGYLNDPGTDSEPPCHLNPKDPVAGYTPEKKKGRKKP